RRLLVVGEGVLLRVDGAGDVGDAAPVERGPAGDVDERLDLAGAGHLSAMSSLPTKFGARREDSPAMGRNYRCGGGQRGGGELASGDHPPSARNRRVQEQ